MKKLINQILQFLWNKICVESFNSRIIYYHSIGYGERSLSPEKFESHLRWLTEQGYKSVNVRDLVKGDKSGLRVCITFDDGYEDNFTIAKPLLEKYQMTATFFICTKFIADNANVASAKHRLYDGLKMMTWKQLRELHKAGFEIGSHTETHAMLSKDSKQKVISELSRSKAKIEEELLAEITSFAYPNGQLYAFSKNTNSMALQNYKTVLTTLWSKEISESNVQGRCEISKGDDIKTFAEKMNGKHDYRFFLDRIGIKKNAWSN